MSEHYILDGHTPVACDLITWARFFEKHNRKVASDIIDGVRISTVFLGLDHQYGDGPPLIFETMIFGGPLDQYQERCSTWDEAVRMHGKAVALVKSPSQATAPTTQAPNK